MSLQIQGLLASALRYHQAGDLAEAERRYREVIALSPENADALHLIGVIAHQQGRHEAAVALIERAIARNGQVPAFHNNHGNALTAAGRLADAVAAYRRAIQGNPGHVEASYNLGMVLTMTGDPGAAAPAFAQAIKLRPDHADAHAGLGVSLHQLGRLGEALVAFDRAVDLQPRDAAKHVNRGNLLKALGKLEEATAAYHRAITLQPTRAEAHNNLALTHLARGDVGAALEAFRRAVTLDARYADATVNLANTLREVGRLDEADAAYRAAAELEPDRGDAQLGCAIAAIPIMPETTEQSITTISRFEAALDVLAGWSTAHPGSLAAAAGSSQPFYLAYRPGDVTAALCRYGDLVSAPVDHAVVPAIRTDDRIRVLVVTAHVRDHPIWRVITRSLLDQLDRSRFEVVLYDLGIRADDQTRWASERVDRYVSGQRSVAAWKAAIRADRPDVIFYPEVGIDPVAGALAASRLAPVQAASWGHPITTGLPTIDLFFSDADLEPADAAPHYRERLVTLRRTGVGTDWREDDVEAWSGPARAPGVVRFALCQQPIKFDPGDDDLYPQIAKASGSCEFWLVMPVYQGWAADRLFERLRNAFARAGLDPDAYLRTTPWMRSPAFNGYLDAMDIYLDCPGFSGYTTALQAVQRGLPIVTREGRFLRQRLASGLLRRLDAPEGITQSATDYVERSAAWAALSRSADLWSERRARLRSAAAAAGNDAPAVADLQEALRAAVERARGAGAIPPGRS